eukprot:6071099-Amphidinium_carterae.1
MRMTHPPRKAGCRLGHHGNVRVYRLWIVVCVLTSVWAQENLALNGLSRAQSNGPWSVVQPLSKPRNCYECCSSALSLNNQGPNICTRHLVFHGQGCSWLPASV